MSADTAINRLSFAEARSSSVEAMMAIARNRQQAEAATISGETADAQAARLEAEARAARAAHQVDKRA